MLKGIDISSWQGAIDFNKVKSEVGFAIMRTGYAKTTDTKFRSYAKGAIASGLPILGVYHFSYALNAAYAIDEAEYCISEVQLAGLSKDTLIFFDFEYASLEYAKKKGVSLTPNEINSLAIAFCDRVEKEGYKAGIYLNNDYYRNIYHKDVLNNYVIWLADYTGGPDHPCHIQQFSSTGQVNGIGTNVDMNYLIDDSLTPKDSNPGDGEKTAYEVANEVIAGKWGSGQERKEKLTNAGYDYSSIQKLVNELLSSEKTTQSGALTFKETASVGIATDCDKRLAGEYETTSALNLRKSAGTNKKSITILPEGSKIYCYGYFTPLNGVNWLYAVAVTKKGNTYIGFCSSKYLKRVP